MVIDNENKRINTGCMGLKLLWYLYADEIKTDRTYKVYKNPSDTELQGDVRFEVSTEGDTTKVDIMFIPPMDLSQMDIYLELEKDDEEGEGA
jgi:hypothetical protein